MGAGAEGRRAIGAVVVGGLLFSTAFTVVGIPVVHRWITLAAERVGLNTIPPRVELDLGRKRTPLAAEARRSSRGAGGTPLALPGPTVGRRKRGQGHVERARRPSGARARVAELRAALPSQLSGWGIGAAIRRWREARKAKGRESFARRVLHALNELSAAGTYAYDAETFELVESTSEKRAALGACYERYADADPEARRDWVAAAAREALVAPIPREFERAQLGLGLSLKSRALHDLERLAHASGEPVILPVASGLVASLHYAGPQRQHPCSRTHLADWGRSLEEAFDSALYNLSTSAPERLVEGPPGVYLSPPSHPAGSTLVCAEKLILSTPLRGDAVVMVPTRSVLLVTGSDDGAGLAAMAEFALRAISGDRPISGTALRWTERGWRRFKSADGALGARLRRIEIPIELREFAEQKALLEALHTKTRESLHVTPAELGHDACGNAYTLTHWTEGVDALLPATDRVVLTRAGARAERLSVDFATALDEVGRCMEATDLYPGRFRVHTFPSGDELRALARRPDCVVERG